MSLHQSPSATAGFDSARSATNLLPPVPPDTPAVPPATIDATSTATLIAMRATVTTGVDARMNVCAVVTRVRWREHSGQRMPTGVGVMQSGQMGPPHDEPEPAFPGLGSQKKFPPRRDDT